MVTFHWSFLMDPTLSAARLWGLLHVWQILVLRVLDHIGGRKTFCNMCMLHSAWRARKTFCNIWKLLKESQWKLRGFNNDARGSRFLLSVCIFTLCWRTYYQFIQSLYVCYSMNFHDGLRYRPKSKMSLGLQFIYSIAFLPSRQRCPRFLWRCWIISFPI